jgi:uroporphyrinogen-III synthase
MGFEPLIDPVLEVAPVDAKLRLHGVGAIAFTSAHGVDAFAGMEARRELRVFAVGEATAARARQAGFQDVRSADGDVSALAALIVGEAREIKGAVLHAGAREPAGDLVSSLAAAGVPARVVTVYETRPRRAEAALAAAAFEALDLVLIHSPRAGVLVAQQLDGQGRALGFLAISEAAAAPLRQAGYADVRVAAAPRDDALVRLIAAEALSAGKTVIVEP